MSDRLTEKAVLVRLSIGQWTARKRDRRVEREVQDKYQSKQGGTYHKPLIAEEEIKKITSLVNEIRAYHYGHTLPWSFDGVEMLPITMFEDYTRKMQAYRVQFETAVERFMEDYPNLIERARDELNGLFNETDYPDPDRVRGRFYYDLKFDPVPDSGDFRVSIQSDELDRMEKELAGRLENARAAAMKEAFHRLHEVVSHAFERLNDGRAIFRDSLVGNIAELVMVLPKLNLTGDPKLDDLVKRAEKELTNYDAQTLRDAPIIRKQVADKAAAILKDMEGYI